MNNNDVDINRCTFLDDREDTRMRVSKGQGLLYIFNVLQTKHKFTKSDIMNELEITELTFWRYIQEIKAFIYNFNLPFELVYDRSTDTYNLIEN